MTSKQHEQPGEADERPSNEPEQSHAPWDEAGSVHQVAEDHSVPTPTTKPGPSRTSSP